MRLTIIKEDKLISIDGNGLADIQQDFSWIPDDVHAVQWYDDHGIVEYVDNRPNLEISKLGVYEKAIKVYENELKRIREEEILAEQSTDYWEVFRKFRDERLQKTDWTQLPDVSLTKKQLDSWKSYRQQLRDLTSIIEDPKPLVLDPDHTSWPAKPY
jgi:hypothetical protein